MHAAVFTAGLDVAELLPQHHLQRYGRKRLVIVHAQEDLGEVPRFLLTDALTGRVVG
jgi:hypothetical protein